MQRVLLAAAALFLLACHGQGKSGAPDAAVAGVGISPRMRPDAGAPNLLVPRKPGEEPPAAPASAPAAGADWQSAKGRKALRDRLATLGEDALLAELDRAPDPSSLRDAADGEATLIALLDGIGRAGGEHAAGALEQSTKAELFARFTKIGAALERAKDQIWTRLGSRPAAAGPDAGAAAPADAPRVALELTIATPRAERFDVEPYVRRILQAAGARVVDAAREEPLDAIIRAEYTEAVEEKYREGAWGTRVGLRLWIYDLRRRRVRQQSTSAHAPATFPAPAKTGDKELERRAHVLAIETMLAGEKALVERVAAALRGTS